MDDEDTKNPEREALQQLIDAARKETEEQLAEQEATEARANKYRVAWWLFYAYVICLLGGIIIMAVIVGDKDAPLSRAFVLLFVPIVAFQARIGQLTGAVDIQFSRFSREKSPKWFWFIIGFYWALTLVFTIMGAGSLLGRW